METVDSVSDCHCADLNLSELFQGENDQENMGNFDLISDRFLEYTDDDVVKFIENQENLNTKKKTQNDMRAFQQYLMHQSERSAVEDLPPEVLARHISRFLLSLRKKDGSEYEPSSLRGFFSSIDRYLRQKNYSCSLLNDKQFSLCRDALKSKQKQLKSQGKGNKPNAAEELTDVDIDRLYQTGQLGTKSPEALINTLWLNNMMYFGMRGGVEQHSLKWGDIKLEHELDGKRYLIYTQERQTKTRMGENPRNIRAIKPRAYEMPDAPDRDPVNAYIEYSKRRPESMTGPDDAFFLSINYNYSNMTDRAWFKQQNMGINKIYSLMKTMKAKAKLSADKRLTNHSARKHLVQKLNDNNVPPNQIIQISGHKNVNSVNNYCTLNANQQAKISGILANNDNTETNIPLALPPAQHSTQTLSSQYSHANASAIFQGSTFHNSVINVYCHPTTNDANDARLEPPAKYRRILPLPIDSDSDSE